MATLLIVEDDLDTNEAVCEYLQDAGHHTISAFDGDEAITLFSENKIDLVVLDIMLPTITGAGRPKFHPQKRAKSRYSCSQLWRMNKPKLPALTGRPTTT